MTLYIGFVILSGLLLWAVIYARGPWMLKLALIITVPLYGVFVWHSIEQWKGYPVRQIPPKESQYIAAIVEEPERIYLWLVPSGSEPRAYEVPYTRELHEQVQAATDIQKQSQGQARIGFRRNHGVYRAYELPTVLPQKGSP